MISRNVRIQENTKDAAGRVLREGDVVIIRGRFTEDGNLVATDITTEHEASDVNNTLAKNGLPPMREGL